MGPKVGDTLKFEEFYGDDDQAWWQVYPAFTPTVCRVKSKFWQMKFWPKFFRYTGICYPLVNVYKKTWKITMLLMGKLTISTGSFSMSQTVDLTRGYMIHHPPQLRWGTVPLPVAPALPHQVPTDMGLATRKFRLMMGHRWSCRLQTCSYLVQK